MLDNESPDNTQTPEVPPAETSATESTAETSATESPAPRRRRRAASRPAGPPESRPEPEAPGVASEVAEPAEDPAAAETAGDEPVEEPAPVKPVKATRARRTRKVVAETDEPGETRTDDTTDPVFDAPIGQSGRQATDSGAVEKPTEDQPAAEAPAEQKPVKKATRRRTTRPAVADPFAVPEIDVSALRPSRRRPKAAEPAPEQEPLVEEANPEETADQAAAVETIAAPSAVSDTETVADADAADADAADTGAADADAADTEPAESDAEPEPESEDADDSAEDSDDDNDSNGRRRRRRRGGRRRRRSGDDTDESEDNSEAGDSSAAGSDESDVAGKSADGGTAKADEADDSDAEAEDDESGSGGRRRRRRRRRRSGEDADESARRRANDAVTGIDGSTRLEAKRQRRREGREAGRRRTPILSEAEFLARREAVRRTMIIRQRETMAQIAVLEDDILVEHYVDHSSTRSLIGNVYLGKVQNVLPSMEAAFIDIGQGRNAVLYAGEVDWDSLGAAGASKDRKIETALKSGQTVLVQVTKDPVGAKGARLTNHLSLPGRYIVYAPGGHLSGISRKLPDSERKRLKQILGEHVDESASVIVRTAAEGATEEELVRDVTRLKAQWEAIEKKSKSGGAPQLLYAEPDPTVRIVRDLFTEDFSELIIAGNGGADDAYDSITAYVEHVAPHLADRVKRWIPEDGADVFTRHRVDEQIAKALERKVHLPSGGSLIIDRTEAMTVIDVNTGKFTGSGGNLEATVTSNNLEAAEEIVRQLRLRDLGGIIVIDFIDMVLPSNRELLLKRLVECLGRDRTRHQVAEVTSLGLVQMTRKRIGTGLGEAFNTPCEHCHGKGYLSHDEPVETNHDHAAEQHNGRGRNRRESARDSSRDSGRGGRKQQAASPKTPTPARQPLPKVMPPPPPGLAKASSAESHEVAGEGEHADQGVQSEVAAALAALAAGISSHADEPGDEDTTDNHAAELAALSEAIGESAQEVQQD